MLSAFAFPTIHHFPLPPSTFIFQPKQMNFFKILSATLCMAGLIHAADRPNILLIFVDDWGRHASAYAKLDSNDTANDILSTAVH